MTFKKAKDIPTVGGDRPDYHIPTIPSKPEWASSVFTITNTGSGSIGSAETRRFIGTGDTVYSLVGTYQGITNLTCQVREFSGSAVDFTGSPSLLNAEIQFYRANSSSDLTIENLLASVRPDDYGYVSFSHDPEFMKKSDKSLWVKVHGFYPSTKKDLRIIGLTYLTSRV